jgi:dipeptidyl-peptidase-4
MRPIFIILDTYLCSIDAVDEDRGIVYFSGNKDGYNERHLFSAPLLNSLDTSITKVSDAPGWHISYVNPTLGMVAESFNSLLHPPRFSLFPLPNTSGSGASAMSTKDLFVSTPRNAKEAYFADTLPVPRLLSLPSLANPGAPSFDLSCCVYEPDPAIHGPGPYPTVVSVYGGPCVQRVLHHWTVRGDMRAQRLAQSGFLVIKCDNRGTSRRGAAFESVIWRNMGDVEIIDQRTVVEHFVRLGQTDPHNVGIYGWSYGGYMSAMSLCKAPDTFKCACAGAPVTFWEGYDTCYTERYMSTPEKNQEGYRSSSVMNNAEGLCGALMIIHGLIDENVHFRHTARLIHCLNSLRHQYELLVFPNERHSPHRLEDNIYTEDRILTFFESHLRQSPSFLPAPDADMTPVTVPSDAGVFLIQKDKLVAHL